MKKPKDADLFYWNDFVKLLKDKKISVNDYGAITMIFVDDLWDWWKRAIEIRSKI